MAEIKSTMEMVMERAAKMAAASDTDMGSEEMSKEGMRLAAAFLREEEVSLSAQLSAASPEDRAAMQKGAVDILLRNIMLPRSEEPQEGVERVMNGLLEVGQNSPELLQVFAEMKKVLEGYLAHTKQLKEQLESQLAQHMAQQGAGGQGGMSAEPSQHPKYHEEWAKVKTQLDEQYGQALTQLKDMVQHQLAI